MTNASDSCLGRATRSNDFSFIEYHLFIASDAKSGWAISLHVLAREFKKGVRIFSALFRVQVAPVFGRDSIKHKSNGEPRNEGIRGTYVCTYASMRAQARTVPYLRYARP